MQTDIQEIYQTTILPLPNSAKLQIATLILEDVTRKSAGENEMAVEDADKPNDERKTVHPLTLIRELAVDVGVTDLAERHGFYAHRKLED